MKNCLVIIGNKKICPDGKLLSSITTAFSVCGYYFDKIAFVAFDSSAEITTQLKECKDVYDNSVVICNSSQRQIICDYVEKLYPEQPKVGGITVIAENKADDRTFGEVIEKWNKDYGISYDKFYIKTVGAPAQLINKALEEAHSIDSDVSYTVEDNFGEQTIAVTYSANTPKMVADRILRAFVTVLDEYVFALENISIAERLFQLLTLRRMRISVAESFTGGGISKKLVEVPGVSQVYFEGLNTYSNQSKMERLGVKELTLNRCGAVSDETAYQMAEGLLKGGNCDVAIATTGIAGPKSDNTNKPVGLAYIAVGLQEQISVYKFEFKGDRENITNTAINAALFLAYKKLK